MKNRTVRTLQFTNVSSFDNEKYLFEVPTQYMVCDLLNSILDNTFNNPIIIEDNEDISGNYNTIHHILNNNVEGVYYNVDELKFVYCDKNSIKNYIPLKYFFNNGNFSVFIRNLATLDYDTEIIYDITDKIVNHFRNYILVLIEIKS